mmetsp:Transcript_486/g.1413  ORF Transcript_486/g.1413 Transcript_486/m.1413 type:complete len:581 (-) Transcript_486:158-1900(-)
MLGGSLRRITLGVRLHAKNGVAAAPRPLAPPSGRAQGTRGVHWETKPGSTPGGPTPAAPRPPKVPSNTLIYAAGATFALAGAVNYYFNVNRDDREEHVVINWSRTHEAKTRVYYQPESEAEVSKIILDHHERGAPVRVLGNGISPNGGGLSDEGMLNMGLMHKVMEVDKAKGQVTVQAGANVGDLVEAIKPHGLTLQNYASIREQQVGGFTQAGCHGTGALIPPVEEQVVRMRLVTPALGALELSRESNPALFRLARCGLGALGVVTEVTLQCVPLHHLLEHTYVTTPQKLRKNHAKALSKNKHLRYMWIPDTDTVVVVTCNPSKASARLPRAPQYTRDERLAPFRDLIKEVKPGMPREELEAMSNTEMRDALISANPRDRALVVRINQAEAEFWKRSEGYRLDTSDNILGFDCGGEQWVSEVAFPTGTLAKPTLADLDLVEETMGMIAREGIAAPAPIEQRWTASSTSAMSPASSHNQAVVHSWVGIIMYLPTQDPAERAAITRDFDAYKAQWRAAVLDRYSAVDHWAKIEVPPSPEGVKAMQQRLAGRYPVEEFNAARRDLDPKNILANKHIKAMFPM